MLEDISGRSIEVVPYERWKREVILPLKSGDPLYPLALYFQGEPMEEIQRFRADEATKCKQRLGVEFSGDYSGMLSHAYDKTLRKEMGF